MPQIEIKVVGRVATTSDPFSVPYICGNNDYTVHFVFDDAKWDAHPEKTARFLYDGRYTDVIFSGDTCPVPLIYNTCGIQVGVYAGDLITTTCADIVAIRSALSTAGIPADPTPDVYRQIMAALVGKIDTQQDVKNAGKVLGIARDGKVTPVHVSGGGGGGYIIGDGLKLDAESNTLSVDTADKVEKDNTKPVTSAAVHTEVGNINALLATI